jgi:glutamate--cysteine ligase
LIESERRSRSQCAPRHERFSFRTEPGLSYCGTTALRILASKLKRNAMRAAAVTTTETRDLEPIRRRDDLLAPFVESYKPRDAWRIGPETEKFGVFERTGAPLPYAGDRSVLRVLQELAASYAWTPESEHEGGPVIALVRGDASVTLEPGGQLELSGGKSASIHQVCAEMRTHMREIGPLSRAMGVRWLGVGFHPFARRDDFVWVPKQRYAIMREYLPTRGGHAVDMMLRTCTVQVNLDYANEADAMRKMRVALALAPATTAMFANSPWKEGRPHGGVTYRGRVWLDVDPDRTGLLPALWKRDARIDDYVEWALDVPMFLFKRGGLAITNTGQTFRSFWKSGFDGHVATLEDWKLHLNTLFPEVRLKKTIELRGADVQSTSMGCALPALWTGIFYDDRALDEAGALVEGWGYAEIDELRGRAWRDGLRTLFRGRPLAEVAERVVAIAEGGLERRAVVDPASGKDERVHLARLRRLIGEARTPADLLLEGLDQEKDAMKAILERTSLTWE